MDQWFTFINDATTEVSRDYYIDMDKLTRNEIIECFEEQIEIHGWSYNDDITAEGEYDCTVFKWSDYRSELPSVKSASKN